MKLFFDKKQEQKVEGGRWNMEWINSKFNIQNSIFHPKGFTLIELMIAVSLFSTAVVIGIGALYSAQHINVKLQATRTIMDSLNLSLEVMTRNMRYGSNFYCGTGSSDLGLLRKNCPYIKGSASGGGSIVFKPVDGGLNDRLAYYVDNNHLMEKISGADAKQISSDDIFVDNLRFYVVGAKKSSESLGDTDQPMVTILLSGRTKDSDRSQLVSFVLQSSVTTRNTD